MLQMIYFLLLALLTQSPVFAEETTERYPARHPLACEEEKYADHHYNLNNLKESLNRYYIHCSCTDVSGKLPAKLSWPLLGTPEDYHWEANEEDKKAEKKDRFMLEFGVTWRNDAGKEIWDNGEFGEYYYWSGPDKVSFSEGDYETDVSSYRLHAGIDLKLKEDRSTNQRNSLADTEDKTAGLPVYPIYPGKVTVVGSYSTGSKKSPWGEYVLIEHSYNEKPFVSVYAHIDGITVKDGDEITAETLNKSIGYIADLRNSMSESSSLEQATHDRDHLHFGLMLAQNGSGIKEAKQGAFLRPSFTDSQGRITHPYVNLSDHCLKKMPVQWLARSKEGTLQPTDGFADVPKNAWFQEFTTKLKQKDIIEGFPSANGQRYYKPEQNMTRAEFLKVALLSSGIQKPPSVSQDVCADVHKEDWFAPYVKYAKDQDYISCDAAKGFRPNEDIIRADAVVMLLNVIGLNNVDPAFDDHFVDVVDGDPNLSPVNIAYLHGIVHGYDNYDQCPYLGLSGSVIPSEKGVFCSYKTINRAEVAKILVKGILENEEI